MNGYVNSSQRAYHVLAELQKALTEELWVLALSSSKRLIAKEMVFRGSVDACPIHPREIFRVACISNASSLVIAHNHPYGECQPSAQDLTVTTELFSAADIMQICIVDHIIVATDGYFSFFDQGLVKSSYDASLLKTNIR